MVNNIILYKCHNDLTILFQKNAGKDQNLIVTNKKSNLQKLTKQASKGIIIYDGIDRNDILKSFKTLNKEKNFILVFLLTEKGARRFNFNKPAREDIYYISRPPIIQELLYILNILWELKQVKFQLKDNENIIKAFESVSEYSRKELKNAYDYLKAHEQVTELSRKELMDAKTSLKAWEKMAEFSRQELISKFNENKAYNNILDFSQSERLFMERVMTAWEHTMQLAREELLKAYAELKTYNKKDKTKR